MSRKIRLAAVVVTALAALLAGGAAGVGAGTATAGPGDGWCC